MFRKLDATRLVATAERLHQRIEERFPDSGLSRVGAELEAVVREAAALAAWLARPIWKLRIAAGATIALLVAALLTALFELGTGRGPAGWADWAQSVEALVNDIVFVGIAVYFLAGLEVRQKRGRAQKALHVLRSLAHIVDMHQLTKDPERIVVQGPDTASSPLRHMTAFELTRYLDYSSELLALISKVAAVYVQELNDPVTVQAANDVEQLAVNLSRTIWQKIVILDQLVTAGRAGSSGRTT